MALAYGHKRPAGYCGNAAHVLGSLFARHVHRDAVHFGPGAQKQLFASKSGKLNQSRVKLRLHHHGDDFLRNPFLILSHSAYLLVRCIAANDGASNAINDFCFGRLRLALVAGHDFVGAKSLDRR